MAKDKKEFLMYDKYPSSVLMTKLIEAEWTYDSRYYRCFLTPNHVNELEKIMSELRRRGDITIEERMVIKGILNYGRTCYFQFKEHLVSYPRREAQKFIGKKNVREFIFKRDNYKCLCCGRDYSLSLDHIIPVSKGGLNRIYNLQTLCMPCNSSKGVQIIDYRL